MFKAANINIIQPKLKIGQPNDRYEQEADAIADKVMQMPHSPPPIQRKCEDCEDEQLKMKPLAKTITPIIQKQSEEEEEVLRMKGYGSDVIQTKSIEPSQDISSKLSRSNGEGSKMSASTNQFMNNAFGTDFSNVNIHTGSEAIQMSRSINARAFAHGNDIYFNKGEYSPESGEGKHLLAHELTHVVQQGNNTSTILQRNCPKGTTDDTHANTVNDDCEPSRERNPQNFITHLYIVPSGSNQASVVAIWSGGSIDTWEATIRDSRTPRSLQSPDRVGTKCTREHTNTGGDHMAYFTGLNREGLNVGFHNSQNVGPGNRSHGCIRVSCNTARIINENTRSFDADTDLSSTMIIYNPNSIPYSGARITVYVIRRGDTLGRIAANHNTTVSVLREMNGISGDRINTGQRLFVPVES